jgi:gas vesicle protein
MLQRALKNYCKILLPTIDNGVRDMLKKSILVALIAMGAIMTLVACEKDTASESVDAVKDAADTTADAVEDAADATVDAAEDAADATADAAEDAADALKEATE